MIANLAASFFLAVTAVPVTAADAPATPDVFPNEGQPIALEAYTDDLLQAGFENGDLAADALVAIASSPGCVLEREAAEAWLNLENRATTDGIELVARWCYRDLATQRRTYRRNCPRTVVVVSSGLADGNLEQQATAAIGPRVCTVPTAKPGNSNHGWGRAIDVKTAGRLLNCESDAFLWLIDNAADFGWVHPEWAECTQPMEEAWHWEWGGTVEPAPPAWPRNIPF